MICIDWFFAPMRLGAWLVMRNMDEAVLLAWWETIDG